MALLTSHPTKSATHLGLYVDLMTGGVGYARTRRPGAALFIEMKNSPSNETMIKAMKTNNATTAYFITEKPRLDAEGYNRIIQQAQQNTLQTCQTFSYQDEEKLAYSTIKKKWTFEQFS